MSDNMTVLYLGASRRRAQSPNGCDIAIKYAIEGESGTDMMWLDEFLAEYADDVKVPTEAKP